jgi:hypothetical protein
MPNCAAFGRPHVGWGPASCGHCTNLERDRNVDTDRVLCIYVCILVSDRATAYSETLHIKDSVDGNVLLSAICTVLIMYRHVRSTTTPRSADDRPVTHSEIAR